MVKVRSGKILVIRILNVVAIFVLHLVVVDNIYTTLFVRTLTAQKKVQDGRKNKQLN